MILNEDRSQNKVQFYYDRINVDDQKKLDLVNKKRKYDLLLSQVTFFDAEVSGRRDAIKWLTDKHSGRIL